MKSRMQSTRYCLAAFALVLGSWATLAQASTQSSIQWPDEGWTVMTSDKSYETLLEDLRQAVQDAEMAVVTEAGPTQAAAQRGETIPGNRVVGVFRNDFAVSIIRESVPAMIEAPLRFYVTEDDADSATLSWKIPSHVFAPYITEQTTELSKAAEELDVLFQQIGDNAVAP